MEGRKDNSNPHPYGRKDDRRKSLLSIVGDTIKEMMSPSWLTDLVTVTQQAPPTPGAEDTSKEKFLSAKHTEMEVADESRPSTSRLPPHAATTQGNGQPRSHDFFQRGPVPTAPTVSTPLSQFTSSQLPLTRLGETSDSVLAQDESTSQRSDDASTSGCSSMNPQPPRPRTGPPTGSPLTTSRQPTRKLWSTSMSSSSSPQRPANISKPSFNPLLYGSPLNSTAGVGGSSAHESSFYRGKVAYGGASQREWPKRQPKRRTNEPPDGAPHPPTRLKLDVKQNDRPVVTATTSRILEVIQSLDSNRPPQKIPSFIFPKNMAQTWKELNNRRQSIERRPSLPNSSLATSTQASISKNRLSCSGFAFLDNRPTPGPSKEDKLSFGTYSDAPAASGKARTKKMFQNHAAPVRIHTADTEETFTVVQNLRTDFTLPVGNIPNFDFSTPTSQTMFGRFGRPNPDFAFSSPIKEMSPGGKAASPGTPGAFQFSSPLSVEQREQQAGAAPRPRETSMEATTQTSATLLAPAVSQATQGLVCNTSPRPKVASGESPVRKSQSAAATLKQGSVMDILGGGSKLPSTPKPTPTDVAPKLSEIFKSTAGTWECAGCLLQCASSATKCLACGTAKSGAATAAPTSAGEVPVKNDLSSLFKVKAGTWECAGCLCKNPADLTKCPVCETPKASPAPAPAKATVTPANNNALSANVSQPASSWTCDTCLISNTSDADVCVACQARRTPAATASHTRLVETHGLLMPGNWICGKCWVQNKGAATVCAHCAATKPDTPVSPPKLSADRQATTQLLASKKSEATFWTCEVCLVRNEGVDAMCVCCKTTKSAKPLRHPAGLWSCDTCGHTNGEASSQCSSCRYVRPAPARTEAVPSCAKTYLEKRATIGATTNSTEQSGFKFGDKSGTSNSNSSGFSFGDSGKKVDPSVTTGGFKFGGSVTTGAATCKFGGSTVSSDKKDAPELPSSGFQFVPKSTTSDNSSSGSKFGTSASTSVAESKLAPSVGIGFAIGKTLTPVTSTNTSVSASTPVTSNFNPVTTPLGGFTFGQKQNKESEALKATTSVPGGFNLTTESSTVKTSESLINTHTGFSNSVTSQSIGGFNSSLLFNKKTETSAIVTIQSVVSSTPSIGGFNFMTSTSTSSANKESAPNITVPAQNTTAFGGFNIAQQKPEVKLSGSDKTSPTKRGRTEDEGESSAKKQAFGFSAGQVNNSTPIAPTFQFQSNNLAVGSGLSFSAFSQQPPATSQAAPPPTAPGGSINFGAAMNKPVNAQPPQQASNTTAAAGFNFSGQKIEAVSSSSSTIGFPTNTGFSFGTNAFGGTPAPTTAPAFGATPSAPFGQSGSGSEVPAAASSTFGGSFQSGMTASTTQGVFQFGAKPPDPTPAPAAAPAAPQQGFNFGPMVATSNLTPSTYNFSSSTAPGSFAFSATSTGTPDSGRKIKKAVRKLRR